MKTIQLLKALLNVEFYTKHKSKLFKDIFPDSSRKLFDTIVEHHEDKATNLSVQDLEALYVSKHPAITSASVQRLKEEVQVLKDIELSENVYDTLVQDAWVEYKAAEIAQLAIDIGDHKERDYTKLTALVEELTNTSKISGLLPLADIEFDTVFDRIDEERKWKFNFEDLQQRLGGIGEGSFGVIAARPEAGKTAFTISLVFGVGGFLAQGAKVLWIANEEPYAKTIRRGISSYTGMTEAVLHNNKEEAKEKYKEIKANINVIYDATLTIKEIDEYVAVSKYDIVIIDQLDKVQVSGEFAREDQKYKYLYQKAREIAIKYNTSVIGVNQASAEAEGKLHYGFECLDGSKTGKAAEADYILLLGMESIAANSGQDNFFRVINIPKNKLTGNHKPVNMVLIPELSRIKR